MKKICYLLVFLSIITALPSCAMKIISHDQNDRIVYSRSSRPDTTYLYDVNEYNAVQEENTLQEEAPPAEDISGGNYITKASYEAGKSQSPEYYNYQRMLLSTDFRRELAGTNWAYTNYYTSEEVNNPNEQANVQNNQPAQANEPAQVNEPAPAVDYQKIVSNLSDKYEKRASREAADYYYVDDVKAPTVILESGFEI